MKTCSCGGMWHRHGTVHYKYGEPGQRYRCKDCGTCITVKDGEIVTTLGRPGPRIDDWRTQTEVRK